MSVFLGEVGKVQTLEIEGRSVRLTNLDKYLWPKERITKSDLLQYYITMSSVILPHWRRRPMTVTRYPHGVTGEFFYQKNCPSSAPEWVETFRHGDTNYVLVNDLSTLIWLANQGTIEFHPAEYEITDPLTPSFILIDLDPTPPLGFRDAVEIALHCRELLVQLNLRGYPKTSGSTGIHIYIPLLPKYGFLISAGVAQLVGVLLQELIPSRVTLERLVKRRRGVYVDYLQNSPGKTLVGVYSPRPTAAATVSAPVSWDELPYIEPEDFTLRNMPERVGLRGDLFEPVLIDKQSVDHLIPVLADFGLDGR